MFTRRLVNLCFPYELVTTPLGSLMCIHSLDLLIKAKYKEKKCGCHTLIVHKMYIKHLTDVFVLKTCKL